MSTKRTTPRPAKRNGPVKHLIAPGLGIVTVAEASPHHIDATCPRAAPPIGIDNS